MNKTKYSIEGGGVLSVFLPYKMNDAFSNYMEKNNYTIEKFFFSKSRGYRFASKKRRLLHETKAFLKLLVNFRKIYNKTVYCTGCQIAVMAFTKFFGVCLGHYRIFIHNFYLHGLSKSNVVKVVLSYICNNQHLTILCQAPCEVEYYRKLSDKVNLEFIPYSFEINPTVCNNISHKLPNDFTFVGGFTNRDYSLVTELALKHPSEEFVFITSIRNKLPKLPVNITLYNDLPTNEFWAIMEKSKIVIIPLKEDVGSSGQMVTLAAMSFKKPIIYSDVQAINYYFENGCGYPYRIGDIESLDKTYIRVLNDNKSTLNGEKAYQQYLNFTTQKTHQRIKEIIEK